MQFLFSSTPCTYYRIDILSDTMSSAAGQLAMLAHGKRVRILYKTILKLHRGLPPDLAYMGDAYVKDEFRRHKKANPEQTIAFMEAWAVSFISFFVGKLCALQQKCVFRKTHMILGIIFD